MGGSTSTPMQLNSPAMTGTPNPHMGIAGRPAGGLATSSHAPTRPATGKLSSSVPTATGKGPSSMPGMSSPGFGFGGPREDLSLANPAATFNADQQAGRMAYATGGGLMHKMHNPHLPHPPHAPHTPHMHAPHGKLHVGPIHSSVAGRTDHLPMHVPSGSYVIPADIISAMGEGNTMAGFKHMRRVFGGEPYGQSGSPYGQGAGPYGEPVARAAGGDVEGVPIVAAGGEYVLSPEQVRMAGQGDLDLGHKVLDHFVKSMRAKTVRTLEKLPGPKKD